MHLPRKEKIGEFWEDTSKPVCVVGDLNKVRMIMAVAPYDYKLLEEDMEKLGPDAMLDVTIRVPGTAKGYYGKVLKGEPTPAGAETGAEQVTRQGGGHIA